MCLSQVKLNKKHVHTRGVPREKKYEPSGAAKHSDGMHARIYRALQLACVSLMTYLSQCSNLYDRC